MPIDQWIGEAAAVDLRHLGAYGEVTAGELKRHGAHVRRGDIVLLRTDWPRRTSVETPRFCQEEPFTGTTGCEWLVARGVTAGGHDYPPDHCIRDTDRHTEAQARPRRVHDPRYLLPRRHHGHRAIAITE